MRLRVLPVIIVCMGPGFLSSPLLQTLMNQVCLDLLPGILQFALSQFHYNILGCMHLSLPWLTLPFRCTRLFSCSHFLIENHLYVLRRGSRCILHVHHISQRWMFIFLSAAAGRCIFTEPIPLCRWDNIRYYTAPAPCSPDCRTTAMTYKPN